MNKKGFGIIEVSLIFLLVSVVGGAAKGLLQYHNHPTSKVDSYQD